MKMTQCEARAKNWKYFAIFSNRKIQYDSPTVTLNRYTKLFFIQVSAQTMAIFPVGVCRPSTTKFSMNNRHNLTIFLLILGLCALPGCIRTFGTDSDVPQAVSESAEEKQAEIAFYDDYNEARDVANQEKKPMLLFFYSPNCVFSQKMLKETFCDADVAKLAKQFVCVKIDESRQRKMCEEYDVKGTPTIQFMNPQGILLQRLTAKKTPNELLLQMQIAIESLAVRDQNRL